MTTPQNDRPKSDDPTMMEVLARSPRPVKVWLFMCAIGVPYVLSMTSTQVPFGWCVAVWIVTSLGLIVKMQHVGSNVIRKFANLITAFYIAIMPLLPAFLTDVLFTGNNLSKPLSQQGFTEAAHLIRLYGGPFSLAFALLYAAEAFLIKHDDSKLPQ